MMRFGPKPIPGGTRFDFWAPDITDVELLARGEALPMRHEGWMKLTFRMVLLFIGLAIANELIWRNLSDTAWVNFKTFGLPVVMFAFFMANARLFSAYAIEKEDHNGPHSGPGQE